MSLPYVHAGLLLSKREMPHFGSVLEDDILDLYEKWDYIQNPSPKNYYPSKRKISNKTVISRLTGECSLVVG
jgi:hypothetical protein